MPLSKWKYRRHVLLLLGLIILFLAVQWLVHAFQKPGHMGIIESQSMEMTVNPPEGAMPVSTERVESGTFIQTVSYPATVVAYNDIPIYPRVEGRVVSMPVYPGTQVQRGQVLAQLDSRELSSKVNEAQYAKQAAVQGYYASVKTKNQTHAQVKRSEQAIQAAKANLSYWQNEIQRDQALVQEDVITREEYQREQSQFEIAKSQYNQALTDLKISRQGAQASTFQAQMQRAQANQAAANVQTQSIIRGYTTLIAPSSGVITERLISQGTLVNPTMPILRMAQVQPIRIQAQVAQSDLSEIRVGNTVQIQDQQGKAGSVTPAQVTAVFPSADIRTHTAIVEAVVPNTHKRFMPGDYVTMNIQTGTVSDAVSVSNRAIVNIGQQQAVWTDKDGKAHLQYVTTGTSDGQRTAVVQGLTAGESVITSGQTDLSEGTAITTGAKGVSSSRLAAENGYQIKQRLEPLSVSITLVTKPPKVGQNQLMIDLVPQPGKPEEDLSLEMTTRMPAMSTMPTPKPDIRRIAPGRFQADVNFMMGGLWQLDLIISRPGKSPLQTRFEVKVPD